VLGCGAAVVAIAVVVVASLVVVAAVVVATVVSVGASPVHPTRRRRVSRTMAAGRRRRKRIGGPPFLIFGIVLFTSVVERALFCHFRFIHPHGRVQGNDLSIDIRRGHGIVVHEIQFANPRANERFYRVAANATDPKNRNARRDEFFHRFIPDE
jgi:hypothetical protein